MEDFEPKGPKSYIDSNLSNKKTPGVKPAGVSTVPPLPNTVGNNVSDTISFLDYHLTVQVKIHLERRQLSLLLSVLDYQAVHYGVTFSMYLSILHLMEILLGQKTKPSEIKDDYERVTVLVSQIIIRDLTGYALSFQEPVFVSEKTKKLLLQSKGLLSKDTYKSRFIHWRPERFLALKTVPVDVIIERNGNSERYTSYCKGYGEGTGTARRGKTPRSFELDGEEAPVWILGENTQNLKQEVFLIGHYEWLKRFGRET